MASAERRAEEWYDQSVADAEVSRLLRAEVERMRAVVEAAETYTDAHDKHVRLTEESLLLDEPTTAPDDAMAEMWIARDEVRASVRAYREQEGDSPSPENPWYTPDPDNEAV